QSDSARRSMCSRNSTPCASRAAPGAPRSYSAHFKRVLPMSMAKKVMVSQYSVFVLRARQRIVVRSTAGAVKLLRSHLSQPGDRHMGLFSFIKDAGEKLFGTSKDVQAAQAEPAKLPDLNAKAGSA